MTNLEDRHNWAKQAAITIIAVAGLIIAAGIALVLVALLIKATAWLIENWDNLHWILQIFITGCCVTITLGILLGAGRDH